jgi:hypothetical protein
VGVIATASQPGHVSSDRSYEDWLLYDVAAVVTPEMA